MKPGDTRYYVSAGEHHWARCNSLPMCVRRALRRLPGTGADKRRAVRQASRDQRRQRRLMGTTSSVVVTMLAYRGITVHVRGPDVREWTT